MSDLKQLSDVELIRQITRQNLEDTARLSSGVRSWFPPAGMALLIWGSGVITGAAIVYAMLSHH